jgi:hypothetical protein
VGTSQHYIYCPNNTIIKTTKCELLIYEKMNFVQISFHKSFNNMCATPPTPNRTKILLSSGMHQKLKLPKQTINYKPMGKRNLERMLSRWHEAVTRHHV